MSDVPSGKRDVRVEIIETSSLGDRASVAASILDRYGREVVLIDDAYATAEKLGLTGPT